MSQTESSKKSVSALNFQPPLPSVSKFIWVICIGLLVLLAWAWFFELEEVSTGSGKVIPSSKEQSIQSLEGGILTKLYVSEGEIVKQGQVLAQLDPTRFASNVGESESLLIASKATAARLRAEVNATPLVFPEDVLKIPKLVSEETALYQSRRSNLNDSVSGLSQALVLVEQIKKYNFLNF